MNIRTLLIKRGRKTVKNSFIVILLAFLTGCTDRYIHQPTGIELNFRAYHNMFPPCWQAAEVKPYAKPLPAQLKHEAMGVIRSSFSKYPEKVLKDNLKRIYVVKELKFYGITYGGTNYGKVVYLAHDYYSLDFIERTFHHEFGAVLLYNNDFDTSAFKLLLPDSASYGAGGFEALSEGKCSMYFDYELIKKGFLCEYGSSCLEEDFCTIVEQLFLPSQDFWDVYDHYPVMRKKIDFIIEFYHSLDTCFTVDYFRAFDTGKEITLF